MTSHILLAVTRILVGCESRWLGGTPTCQPKIYFCNHASHLDTLILLSALPFDQAAKTHPLAAKDYWGSGEFKKFIATYCLNAVLIDRKGGERDPLKDAKKLLSSGQSIIIFPEGSRAHSDEPGLFKSGLYHLSDHFPDVELVPTYLNNTARAYPKGAILPAPIFCQVLFGAPLKAEGLSKDDFLLKARNAVIELAKQKDCIK